MLRPRKVLIATIGLTLASAAAAAEPPEAEQSPIVVTGERIGRNAVRDFVRDLTPRSTPSPGSPSEGAQDLATAAQRSAITKSMTDDLQQPHEE